MIGIPLPVRIMPGIQIQAVIILRSATLLQRISVLQCTLLRITKGQRLIYQVLAGGTMWRELLMAGM